MKRVTLLLLCLLLLAGCGPKAQEVVAPLSQIPGYYTNGQIVSGGETIAGANLRTLDAGVYSGETMISLSFVSGSMKKGDQEGPLNQIPVYSVESLAGPARLRVELAIDHWDYAGSEMSPSGLLQYMTMMAPTAQGEPVVLFFQFTGKIAYKIEENKGMLVIRVQPDEPDQSLLYYATLEMSNETRSIAKANKMMPVICEDGETLVYLSKPFARLDEADALVLTLNKQMEAAALNARAGVIEHKGSSAPSLSTMLTQEELDRLGALRQADGSLVAAEPWAVDARFLCWLPDGEGALCARPAIRSDGESFEEIWVYNTDGTRFRYLESEITYVQQAKFSNDGRYLAFMDKTEYRQLMYLYDTADKSLDFLSAEGLSDFTVDFSWSDNGLLYVMSGDEEMRLLACDPAMETEDESRVTPVEEAIGSFGSVFCAGEYVYFNDGESGMIVRVEPVEGIRTEYVKGTGFSISPDGKTMLIIRRGEDGDSLLLQNIETQETRELTNSLPYRASCWSLDGQTLHFLLMNEDEDYPCVLYRANAQTGEVEQLGALASDSIYTGSSGRELVLVAYYGGDGDEMMPITYRLPLSN